RAGHRVHVGVRPERYVIRDEERSESAAHHRLRINRVGKTESRHELVFGKWQVVAARVPSSLHQEEISDARTTHGSATARHGTIRSPGVKERHLVVAFRP